MSERPSKISWEVNRAKQFVILGILLVVAVAVLLLVYGVGVRWAVYSALAGVLLALACIDFNRHIIPNRGIIAILVLWVLFIALCAVGLVHGESNWLESTIDGLLGAGVVGGASLLVSVVLEVFRGHMAVGGGDIKLLFTTSLFLGLAGALIGLFLGCLFVLVLSCICRSKTVPFGPAVVAATLLVLIGGPLLR